MMCLVLALCLWTVAIYRDPLLSLEKLHVNLGIVYYIVNHVLLSSFRSCIIGITSLSAYDSSVYSDSVINSVISV